MSHRDWYYSLHGALSVLYYTAQTSSKIRQERGRKCEFDITQNDIRHLWDSQDGKCYYSGIPMNYDRNDWRVSLERTDTQQGYTKKNIVLCCLEFNSRVQWSKFKVYEMLSILDSNIKENYVDFELPLKEHKKRGKVKNTKKEIEGIMHCMCNHCKGFKPLTEFYTHPDQGCKECCNIRRKLYSATPRGALTNLLRNSKLATRIRAQKSNGNKDTTYDLNFQFLVELYNKQKGLCAYSGLPLQFGSSLDKNWVASLERKNTFKGYTTDNVCLICAEFNTNDQSVKLNNPKLGNGGWTADKFLVFYNSIKASF